MRFFYFFSILVFSLSLSIMAMAQPTTGGVITYEQIVDYQLEGAMDNPKWDSYIADLPKRGKTIHQLYYTPSETLYKLDEAQQPAQSSKLLGALEKMNYMTPQEEVKQIYVDLNQRERIEYVTFMTRQFRIKSRLEPGPWKLTPHKKKILDYVCMGANMESGQDTLTAWFAPEIPVSAGPGPYHGLPGMILGLAKNGDIFLLATRIDRTPPDQSLKSRLPKATSYNRETFNQIKAEKIEEYQRMQKQKYQNAKGKN